MSDDEQKKDETTEETPRPRRRGRGSCREEDPSPAEETPAEEAPAAEEPLPLRRRLPRAEEAPAEEAAEALPLRRLPPSRIPRTIFPGRSGAGCRNRGAAAQGRRLQSRGAAAERAEDGKRKGEPAPQAARGRKAERTPGTGTPPAERESNAAKVRQGIVVSSKGDKSITVRIDIARRHRTYEKIVRSSTKLHAHDERNEAGEGDVVRVVETRPLSKTKRWRLVDVVEKAR